MKLLLTILIFTSSLAFGQIPKSVSLSVVDEDGKPVKNAFVYYGDRLDDSAYSNKKGVFKVICPDSQTCRYYFHIKRNGFLPNSFYLNLSSVNKPIVLRSRKGFWYDARNIDSTHLGITVKEAITKYKLDINECLLWSEPPGSYHNFTTELGDSSYIRITFKGIFSKEKSIKMTDVLDRVITGIGIGFTDGTVREFGKGYADENPYFVEQQMKMGKQ
jgi:hypothetical protein